MARSIDGEQYVTESIISGDNILLCVGPPQAPDGLGGTPLPGDVLDEDSQVYLVGLVQNYGSQTGRPQRQLAELGGKAKYLISSRGQKKISLSRIITDQGSALRALYRWYVEHNAEGLGVDTPNNDIWMSVDHPLLKKPIGLLVSLGRIDASGDREEIERFYMEDVIIESVGANFMEGDKGMLENVSMAWATTKRI